MIPATKAILERIAFWPDEDQQKLSELVREIETRRTGIYHFNENERAAIGSAHREPFATNDE